MITIDEAQARILALKQPVEAEYVTLADAAGRWASRDVVALRTQPARDLSAMDGYAVRFADGPGPWRVTGESAAGKQFTAPVGAGEAVRIFTGAVVPDGTDLVIIQECVTQSGDSLLLTGDAPTQPGHHVRHAGADFCEGAVIITAGALLHARHLALAAMAGHSQLWVRRRLRVALISSGNELMQPGQLCLDDQIPCSNAVMLAAMLRGLPVDVRDFGIIGDNIDSLKTAFNAARDYDVVVTTGGASVGDHDLIIPALQAAGGVIDFWKIAMRPGKPVIAGQLGKAVVLGLPGNPVSAYVTAMLLLMPLLRHVSGAAQPLPQRLTAALAHDLPANGPRTDHLRAQLSNGKLAAIGMNDSAMLAALSLSNALIIREIDAAPARAGDDVVYYPLGE
jgi:molybdopterin molybdotransferase